MSNFSYNLLKISKIILSDSADEEQNVQVMFEYYERLYNSIKSHNNNGLNDILKYVDIKVNEAGYNYSDIELNNELKEKYKISPIAYALKNNNLYAFNVLIKNGADVNDKTLGESLIELCSKNKKLINYAILLIKNNCEIGDYLITNAKINKNNEFIEMYNKTHGG